MSNFQALKVVDRGSETQPQVFENLNKEQGSTKITVTDSIGLKVSSYMSDTIQ